MKLSGQMTDVSCYRSRTIEFELLDERYSNLNIFITHTRSFRFSILGPGPGLIGFSADQLVHVLL